MPTPHRIHRASLLLPGLFSVLLSSPVFADGPVYRTITREYRTDSYYTKGLMVSEVTAAGTGAKFVETEHTYALRDVTTGKTGMDVDAGSTTATLFPMLARTDRRFYEGQGAAGKATYTTHEYDALGKVNPPFAITSVPITSVPYYFAYMLKVVSPVSSQAKSRPVIKPRKASPM